MIPWWQRCWWSYCRHCRHRCHCGCCDYSSSCWTAAAVECVVGATAVLADVQHENMIGDINAKIGEGAGGSLHLPTVVVDAEVALNEAPESGVDVEGTSFTVAEEVVL
jgi:hypothetical protein